MRRRPTAPLATRGLLLTALVLALGACSPDAPTAEGAAPAASATRTPAPLDQPARPMPPATLDELQTESSADPGGAGSTESAGSEPAPATSVESTAGSGNPAA